MPYQDYIDYKFAIARGLADHTVTVISAYTTTLSATAGFVLQPDNKWAQTMPATAVYVRLSSSDAGDATAGAGATDVTIYGILGSGTGASETIKVSGQTPKTSTGQYIRINRMVLSTCGASLTNMGVIYCGESSDSTAAGVPKSTSTVLSMIAAREGASFCGRYYVPAGYTAYITNINTGSGLQEGNTTWNVYEKPDGDPARLAFKYVQNRAACEKQHMEIPRKFAAKTDIWVEATGAASAASCSFDMELLLVAGD